MGLDPGFRARFDRLRPSLEAAIEEHLPGRLEELEEAQSTMRGYEETVDHTKQDPQTSACARRILAAAEWPTEDLKYVDKQESGKQLDALEQGLLQSRDASKELSISLLIAIQEEVARKVSSAHTAQYLGYLISLSRFVDAIQPAIEKVRSLVDEHGDDHTGANLRAAAIALACAETQFARTRIPVPRHGKNRITTTNRVKQPYHNFLRDVFTILRVNITVPQALDLLHRNPLIKAPQIPIFTDNFDSKLPD